MIFLGVFKPNDERNKTKNALTIDDFNNYIYPTKLWVNVTNASNAPEKNYGFLEVKKVGYKEGDPNADCVQIFYVVGNVDNIYYRRKGYEVSTWTNWFRLSNNTDIDNLQNALQNEININKSRMIAVKDRIIISFEKLKSLYHSSGNQDYLQAQPNILKNMDWS